MKQQNSCLFNNYLIISNNIRNYWLILETNYFDTTIISESNSSLAVWIILAFAEKAC